MTTELAPVEHAAAATLFAGATPTEVVTAATSAANALSDMIRRQKLYQKIGQREHVLVEGWQACGTLAGVFAVKDGGVRELPWPTLEPDSALAKIRDEGLAFGFVASYRAEKDGREVGWGEGRCTRAESNWRKRDDYALSSMAQTRGQSRALRQPLGFVVSLAGYSSTPAEEMNGNEPDPDASPFGRPADEPFVAEATAKLDEQLPGRHVTEFADLLANTLGRPLPDAAARTLKGLAWWLEEKHPAAQPEDKP